MSALQGQPPAQLLTIAPPERLQDLRSALAPDTGDPPAWRIVGSAAELVGPPALVLLSLSSPLHPPTLEAELGTLGERWRPAPLLVLLPAGVEASDWGLRLPAEGVLQDPSPTELRHAVAVLLAGGRVLRLARTTTAASPEAVGGLGQALLLSGLQQIEAELGLCMALLDPPPPHLLALLLLRGRVRELRAARALLLWLWGPLQLAFPLDGTPPPSAPASALTLSLRQRTADAVWETIEERLEEAARGGVVNTSGRLLALDGLHPDRRRELLLALLAQFAQLRQRLQLDGLSGEALLGRWQDVQTDLRRSALRQLAGTYVRLPMGDSLRPVADTLLNSSDLSLDDPELPDPRGLLVPLLEARPVVVDGRLHAPDDPTAVLHLERLLANWLVRSGELISAELLACCAEWPELRRYLLEPDLLPTRNLERVRNQLNAQQRWSSWFERPVQLYESRRPLYRLEQGRIAVVELTEPRDSELRRLAWPQQLVTIALEARDALAPQLRALLRQIGDLIVVVLTEVVGRAIGLVGRGILQGMGRSVGRP